MGNVFYNFVALHIAAQVVKRTTNTGIRYKKWNRLLLRGICRCNLQDWILLRDKFHKRVVIRATTLSNLQGKDVARQVARKIDELCPHPRPKQNARIHLETKLSLVLRTELLSIPRLNWKRRFSKMLFDSKWVSLSNTGFEFCCGWTLRKRHSLAQKGPP